jgi:hypothetical protein
MKSTRMIKIFLVATAILLGGCASFLPPSEPLQGQWYFTHIRKGPSFFGQFPPPPTFDSFTFTPPDKIHLRSSLPPLDFDGTYHLADHQLSYEFHPPDMDKPVKHVTLWGLQDSGQTLVLTFDQMELVYYRPARFLPNTIAGEWMLEIEGNSGTMHLGEAGSYRLDPGGILGHYRLWSSRSGDMMTVVVHIPGFGGQLMLFRYLRRDDRLELTPATWDGFHPEQTTRWKLSSEGQHTPALP